MQVTPQVWTNTVKIRRTASERKAALEKEIEEKQKKLSLMNARERTDQEKIETRRKIVIGAILLGRAKWDEEFKAQLRQFLLEAVATPELQKRPHDVRVIHEYLNLPSPQKDMRAAAEQTVTPSEPTTSKPEDTAASPAP